MAAAVIELDSLPNAVGSAAQNDDFLFLGWRGLVFVFVGGIEIGSEALEFRRAGIDALIDRHHSMFLSQMPNLLLTLQPPNTREPSIGESHALGFAQHFCWHRFDGMLFQFQLLVVDLL